MMKSEFIERTGLEPTEAEYREIEAEYMRHRQRRVLQDMEKARWHSETDETPCEKNRGTRGRACKREE